MLFGPGEKAVAIPNKTKSFRNLRYLILDCLWIDKHPSHFNLETSLKMINELKPKKAILTNL